MANSAFTPTGVAAVSSVNSFTGAITIAAGSNVTVTNSAGTITIASTGGGGGTNLGLVYAIASGNLIM